MVVAATIATHLVAIVGLYLVGQLPTIKRNCTFDRDYQKCPTSRASFAGSWRHFGVVELQRGTAYAGKYSGVDQGPGSRTRRWRISDRVGTPRLCRQWIRTGEGRHRKRYWPVYSGSLH